MIDIITSSHLSEMIGHRCYTMSRNEKSTNEKYVWNIMNTYIHLVVSWNTSLELELILSHEKVKNKYCFPRIL